jgi:hypothetical protein
MATGSTLGTIDRQFARESGPTADHALGGPQRFLHAPSTSLDIYVSLVTAQIGLAPTRMPRTSSTYV